MATAKLPKPTTHVTDRQLGGFAVDTTRGNEGRLRYHGSGRRGAPPNVVTDAADVRQAIAQLRAALESYADARAVLGIDDVSVQRQAKTAKRVALGHVELAARFLDDLILRRGGALP